jgi:biopolymer transport protein ExbD
MDFKTENKLLVSFNYSSLTDIVFLLLIFFLLSSSFIVQSGIKVRLPTSHQEEVKQRENVTITLTKEGVYFFNDRKTTLQELPAMLQKAYQEQGDRVVVLKADAAAKIEQLVSAMDMAKIVGYERFSIATERDFE